MPKRRMTLRQQIEARIAKRRDDALLTREFLDLGGERQVLRALRQLTDEGKLIRLGYGAYGRAEISRLTNQPMLVAARNDVRSDAQSKGTFWRTLTETEAVVRRTLFENERTIGETDARSAGSTH